MKNHEAIEFAEAVIIGRDNSETNEAVLMVARGKIVEAKAYAQNGDDVMAQQSAWQAVVRVAGIESWEANYLARATGILTES